MTEAHTNRIAEIRGFTSISRWLAKAGNAVSDNTDHNQHLMHQRRSYLIRGEAITLGIFHTVFLLAAITCEFTARSDSWGLFISIPLVTFIVIHVLCLIAWQLTLLAKPVLAKAGHWCQDIAQGATIILIFTVYAILRVLHPIADWFTPIAWIWIGIWAVDCLGRVAEWMTPKTPVS